MTTRRSKRLHGPTAHRQRAFLALRPGPIRRNPASDPWSALEWEQHKAARDAVAARPDGMTLEQIGALMCLTRERVRQIEVNALRKLRDDGGAGFGSVENPAGVLVTVAIPDCEGCGEPFVRMRGVEKLCELCEGKKRKRRPAGSLALFA